MPTFTRSFRVPESPDRARRIIAEMSVHDGSSLGVLPPGVSTRREAPGSFVAEAPCGTSVHADLYVTPDGGGSLVTERYTSRSFVPGYDVVAGMVHGVFTDPEEAYLRVRRRIG